MKPIDLQETIFSLALLTGGISGLFAMWSNLKTKLNVAIVKTDENRREIEDLHKTVNSAQTAADEKRKQEADEKQDIAVKLAQLESQRDSSIRAAELASRERDAVREAKVAAEGRYAELLERFAELKKQVGVVRTSDAPLQAAYRDEPVKVVVINPPEAPIPVTATELSARPGGEAPEASENP